MDLPWTWIVTILVLVAVFSGVFLQMKFSGMYKQYQIFPSYVFSIMWTYIYLSLIFLTYKTETMADDVNKKWILMTTVGLVILSALWTPVMYAMRNPTAALVIVLAMILGAGLLLHFMAGADPLPPYVQTMVYPLFVWLGAAFTLNFKIMMGGL